jgi:hypothetical protein
VFGQALANKQNKNDGRVLQKLLRQKPNAKAVAESVANLAAHQWQSRRPSQQIAKLQQRLLQLQQLHRLQLTLRQLVTLRLMQTHMVSTKLAVKRMLLTNLQQIPVLQRHPQQRHNQVLQLVQHNPQHQQFPR